MNPVIENRLRRLIETKGYKNTSYRQLAKAIGISHLPLFKMVNGQPYNPSLEMLDKLCRFFRCNPGDILVYKRK